MGLPPSFPPSSSPPQDCPGTNKATTVEVFVTLAVVAMFLFHILGSLRRGSSNGLLHAITAGVYTLSYPLVSYTIGLMKVSEYYYEDVFVWAVFLLLLLGGTDSLTACRLDDIDNWKSILVKHLFKGLLLVYVLWTIYYGGSSKPPNLPPLWAIMVVVVLKGYVRIASMRMVTKSYLGRNVKVIDEYMQHKDKLSDPVTMNGCSYMVAGEKYCVTRPGYKADDMKKVTTVGQIWQCEGKLLRKDDERVERLKDVCLSMALSKMLSRRFAGFTISEAELPESKDFVFKGLLLVGDKPQQRAFRVIEEELVFVHDTYYTRYSYLNQKGRYLALYLPVIMIALCSWLTFLLVKYHRQQRALAVTIFITVVLAFLEAYQLYLYIASGWFKVALIQSYVSEKHSPRSCCCLLEMIMDLLLRLKAFPPWKRRLGQYCFLPMLGRRSAAKTCIHYATLRLVDNKARKGSKNSVKLSENVKTAIIESLLGSHGHLTNGLTSLRNNGVHGQLSWACDVTGTHGALTRTILVWHIATTLCEHQLDAQAKKEDAVKTASALSRYCMHLLVFAPNLLPDHCAISESILDQSADEAVKLLEEVKDKKVEKKCSGICPKKQNSCEMLMEISTMVSDGNQEAGLVMQGVQLARKLIQIEDIQKRWKVLSDFWAEMMLYVSPSDDARAHLEALARGGEFITHLWALLTHAGVLNRGPNTGPNNAV